MAGATDLALLLLCLVFGLFSVHTVARRLEDFYTRRLFSFQVCGILCKISGLQRKDAKTQRNGLIYASGGYALHVVWAYLGYLLTTETQRHRVFMVTPPAAMRCMVDHYSQINGSICPHDIVALPPEA
jgi:hypothetical protein